MTTKQGTVTVLAAAAMVLIGWDVYVAANPIKGDTISEMTLAFAMAHPVVPFALGVLFGHLFWSQKPPSKS